MAADRVAFLGCHDVGAHVLAGLVSDGIVIDFVVSLAPDVAARANVSGYRDLVTLGEELGLPGHHVSRFDMRDERDLAFFAEGRFDVLLTGGWMRLVPEPVLATLRLGGLGVHGSADRLPKGRGRSPLNWSLIEGRRRFLLHLFLMQAGADDGDVLAVEDFDITEHDTIRTLYMKNAIATRRMIRDVLPDVLAGTAEAVPQRGTPSYYAKRTPEDGAIDWEEDDVDLVDRTVRALTRPYPGAYGLVDGALTTIWAGFPFDRRLTYPDARYGEVVERFDGLYVVNCRGGLYAVTDDEPRAASSD